MPIKIDPPFDFISVISEVNTMDTDKFSLKRLRDVVAGRDTTYPRSRGMDLLLATDFPNKHRDFEAVLENEDESPDFRYIAAINLGKINIPAAIEILVKNCYIRDERVLIGVMKALGRIGNTSALDAIATVRKNSTGIVAMQADFAATLIAHREGLDNYELFSPETHASIELDSSCARPMRITEADDEDAELCLRSIASQPFGIEFLEHKMVQARCGQNTWMILLNRDFGDKNCVQKLEKQKAFLGVVAIRNEKTRLYTITYLLLTSPAKNEDSIRIQIYRTNGVLSFAGTASLMGDSAKFSILALPLPGAFGVKIEGIFEDGRLNIETGLSTTVLQIKKHEPIEESDTVGRKYLGST
jgi:hypothetical protein